MRTEAGSFAVETVLLTPVLVGCILVIAGGARYVDARGDLAHTAAVAARAAALERTAADARAAGREAARAALQEAHRSCRLLTIEVDTSAYQAGGLVQARVSCTIDLSDLAGVGFPGSRTFTAAATVPLEAHRVL